jgi:hypothetical protein
VLWVIGAKIVSGCCGAQVKMGIAKGTQRWRPMCFEMLRRAACQVQAPEALSKHPEVNDSDGMARSHLIARKWACFSPSPGLMSCWPRPQVDGRCTSEGIL